MQVSTLVNPVLPQAAQRLSVDSDPAAAQTDAKPVVTQSPVAVTAPSSSPRSENEANAQKQQNDASRSPVDEKSLNKSIEKLNNSAKMFNAELEFSVDSTSGRQVVKVIDKSTQTVIRQIPSEEAINMSEALDKLSRPSAGQSSPDESKSAAALETFKGLLVSDKA
ncbi:flagellar protein FlaG [Paludibacterium paludis]|nr:flagellar protein FlaG [Paludibacterium paludis]